MTAEPGDTGKGGDRAETAQPDPALPERPARKPGAGPLWTVVLLLLAAALALWGASALAPGLSTAVGLAAFAGAAVAGVLASAGWFRRVLGAVVVLVAIGGGALLWDGFSAHAVAGSALAVAGLLALLGAGILVFAKGGAMPGMGGKYAADKEVRRSVDADRRLWESLSEGADPTLAEGTETTNDLATQGGSGDPVPEPDRRRG
ncbi:hypothetical protein JOF53_006179 [Crossiella equi]|uniref:Tryptophan-associated transmembrane protein n=1 Tax=Crossiella equi TaxID=130796 RepID=A0ABS5AL54_9PSEU|nr:Trp biosynthesis-associated membrane protein [Crossiella equi]MBP2477307.1 hypothetical protein [Crossiella equi]